jgi:hypothetical protein
MVKVSFMATAHLLVFVYWRIDIFALSFQMPGSSRESGHCVIDAVVQSLDMSEQAISLYSVSAIGLSPCSVTAFTTASYSIMVTFRIYGI